MEKTCISNDILTATTNAPKDKDTHDNVKMSCFPQ